MTDSSSDLAKGSGPNVAGQSLLLAIVVAVVVIDQLTKAWAVSTLSSRTIHVFWTLQLHLSYNTGMAFGTGRGVGPIIGAFAMIVVVGLLLTMRRGGGTVTNIAVGLVVGGAIGNLLDRLFRGQGWLRGGVVDFIDFQWFPIFNVADMAITIGGAVLVLNAYRNRSETSEQVDGGSASASEPTTGA